MSATDNTVDDEGLTTALRESPFTRSPEVDIWKQYRDSEWVACARAFLAMARAEHRPLSGDIERHPELLDDPRYLYRDAVEYAQAFLQSRDCDSFWIDQPRRRAAPPLVWAVEAARELAAGGYARAVMLMRMAIEQIEAK
jgi:hypothetical protein